MTIQPFDAPDSVDEIARAIDHLGSDAILLYASDYPHWQFDGDDVLPPGISGELRRKIMVDNPNATYPL
jgi:predicted TIM-barrel fold metal-dependent hydrolase